MSIRPRIFPFSAVVGQERMTRSLVLNAIDPRIGGVLIRGERGTAKSTAARGLAALLPDIAVVDGCPFNCDPGRPDRLCDECRDRVSAGEELPVTHRRTAFVDLPVSATEDRVVGTLDIEKAIQKGERHFDPGVLAAANRGLLYVDEVNLLDDHVVDLLLDSAAMGINVVEREGISFSHPARFILVGTMNPEEGDLRPQLLDRFALCVDIQGLTAVPDRMAILERNIAFESDPEGFFIEWSPRDQELSQEIARARQLVAEVEYTRHDLATIATLTGSLRVDGHRADLVILKAARAHAAFEGRTAIADRDILLAAELALPHRLRRQPFQRAEISSSDLQNQLDAARAEYSAENHLQLEDSPAAAQQKKRPSLDPEAEEPEAQRPAHPSRQVIPSLPQHGQWWEGGEQVDADQEFQARRLDTPLDRLTRSSAGRRSQTRTKRKRGRYIQAEPAPGDTSDLAFDATFRAAAPHQVHRDRSQVALALRSTDLHRKVRVRRAANLVLFVVDASWSMAVAERMEATKGAIFSLLSDAYQRRDRVGLVVFQKNDATLVLPPTNSVDLARQALVDIPVGGKTPLASGLALTLSVVNQEKRVHPDVMPLVILLTDGAGNVSLTDLPPQEEAYRVADLFREQHIRSVVINMEHAAFDQGLAQRLADRMGAPCYTHAQLKAQHLYRAVRDELEAA
jgi:magnesium chelatase subunit D